MTRFDRRSLGFAAAQLTLQSLFRRPKFTALIAEIFSQN
jgi:hypothetical protein